MENQEHQDFNEDAAFDEAVKTIESGELTADSKPTDADKTETDKPDQLDNTEATQPSETDADPDWLTTASDEVKENFRKLEAENKRLTHMERSQRGRVGSLTKKYQQAMDAINQAKQTKGNYTDEFERLRDDYPELADVLIRFTAEQDKRLTDISNPLSQIAEANVQDLSNQQVEQGTSIVYQQFPDVEEIVANPNFGRWLNTLPPSVQAMSQSNNPDDVIYLLGEFKRTTVTQQTQRERKSQQLSAMSLPNGRNAPKGGHEELDEDALFNKIANSLKKQRY